MKRNLGKGKAKGTVLFTVVTVMLVMVVLLMTTLTLTSAASRRSYYTYFESQAQYAAQAAIDAITYGAYQDDAFHDFVVAAPHESDVSDTNPAPEIQIRFDGSTIPFTNGDNTVRCTIERLDPDAKWDDATNALHTRDMWRITATAHVGTGRNEATYSISEYLYENFQVAAEDLVTAPTNRGNYLLTRYITTPGSEDEVVVAPMVSSPGVVFFGNQGFSNNMVTLGPAYNNLTTLPLGWGNYQDKVNYDVTAYDKRNFRADPYDLLINNHAIKTVGDVIFVNNVYDRVVWDMDFQSPNEGAVIYGNLGVDNNGFKIHPMVQNFDYAADGKAWYEDNCNYLYVDGMVEGVGGAKNFVIGAGSGEDAATNPVNLYCGGIMMNNVNYEMWVNGDVYMYDPAQNSIWQAQNDSPLNEWVGMEITKTSGPAANSVGGNIICNNASLKLGGGNKPFTIPGDVIMTNPLSTLTLESDVRVAGKVISAGTVTGAGVAHNTVVQGTAAYNDYSRSEYGEDYIAAQGGGDFDYRLMPFEHRIDEIFERYYRWDLQSANVDDMTTAINDDELIRESISAGHDWLYDAFNTPSGTVYVPYTEPVLDNRFVIKKHQYFNPADAIGQIVDNHMANYTDYGTFVGAEGLPKFGVDTPERLKDVTVVSHDASGTIHEDTIPENLYVIRESCEIDLADYPNSGFFIDPSDLTGTNILKIALKGTENHSGSNFYFIVNNTADYAGDDYTAPTAYCDQTPIKSASRTQVQVFLESSFGTTNANPHFMTSGAWYQMNHNTLSVVQNPPFPTEDDDLSRLEELQYSYELVPNFTMFGEAGVEYNFENSNAARFNADIAMPMSSMKFGTVNSGNYTVTYRETVNSKPSTGESYLWSISSIMLESLKYNDDYAMSVYIGGIGTTTGGPGITTAVSDGSGGSARLGENRNPWFNNEHIGN
ncbi:MAG: hypothetical protein IKI77_01620 [Oscillospiraceae bacterium]|nr:hypothetical protein [Oscillospiraceae bacterium]